VSPTSSITLTFVFFAFLWGAVWGSFLNVVIYRLPRGQSLSRPSSRCPHCGTPIRWYDNVPVWGWFALRGKCRDCAAPVSPRYPLVEALVGLLAVAIWLHVTHGRLDVETLPQAVGVFALHFYFVAALVAIAFIDLDLTIIPHKLSIPLIAWGFVTALLMPKTGVWVGYAPMVDLVDSAIGAALGFGLLFAVFGAYRVLRGVDGGGGGDLWLLAAIGANLGWVAIPFVLFAASLQGLAAALVAMLLPKRASADDEGGFLIKGAHREEYWASHPVLGEEPPAAASGSDDDAAGVADSVGEDDMDGSTQQDEDERFLRLAVPFGPFLALAAIEYIFFGRAALRWVTSGLLP
jgi:leader peptidase (prepilin peptidase)/N-methyltransferase